MEEGSIKLQEVVKFLEGQQEAGPALLEALGNADVFYEMQYKEVKIVANVSSLVVTCRKRKDGCLGFGYWLSNGFTQKQKPCKRLLPGGVRM